MVPAATAVGSETTRGDGLFGPLLAVFAAAAAYGLVLPVLPALLARGGGPNAAAQVGALMAAYTIAGVALSPIWGWLLDRYSARAILCVGVIGQGAVLLALWWPMELPGLYAVRLAQGALAAAVGPAVLTLAARIVSRERHGVAVARASRAALLGGLTGPLVGGLLARGTDLRWPIVLACGLSVVAALAAAIPRDERAPQASETAPDSASSVRGAARLAFATIIAGLAMGAMEVGIAVRGRESFGLDAQAIGLMFSGCGAVMILVQTLVFRPERDAVALWRLIWPSFVMIAVGLALLALVGAAWMLSVVVTLVAAGGGVLLPAISLWIVRLSGRSHGMQLGLRASLAGLGQAAGAAAAGYAFRAQSPVWELSIAMIGLALAAARLLRDAPTAACEAASDSVRLDRFHRPSSGEPLTNPNAKPFS